MPEHGHLVLYDGVCGLCDRAVRFVLRRDRSARFLFAPLQGPSARAVVARHGLPPDLETIIYVEDFGAPPERVFTRSEGALRIIGELGGLWRMAGWLRIVPRPIRDRVYNWIARHRYNWFGRFDECPLPPPEVRKRFLE